MLECLPDRLRRRTRLLNDREPGEGCVIYWMRTAVRAHENPALDVAILVANALRVPVFVYHALSERYPYASDRHHRFILEGARDVAVELGARGIATAFHLERAGHRGDHLHTLGSRAAAVVTEEMPVAPLRHWTRALADRSPVPVLSVDTACTVPMRSVGKGVDRAFAYRRRVMPLLDRELAPWDEVEPEHTEVPPLPFEPVDLGEADLDALIAECAIDHTVPPVHGTTGGSTAGYARWNAFVADGLSRYAARRNDPTVDGTSRLSPWLHYGMVAPTRIAREARKHGAEKFLDELVVWRELAYTWCLYAPDHHSLDALPTWARDTLLAHAGERAYTPGLERLHLGQTGELLWDLAQQSLLRRGELHNNVRMTWGKALVPWTSDPGEALRRLVDLNHRYALDGRDPASYGGLLWCLGLFDRAFPESPAFGEVRSRSVKRHAARVDLDAWARVVRPPRELSVGIVGAGLAGSFAGRVLATHGAAVTLFDKGRGAGGRLACRRRDDGLLIHGAPQLHLADPRLERWTDGWVEAGVLSGCGTFVSDAPNDLVKHLQAGLDVRFGARVHQLHRDAEGWWVDEGDRSHRFDAVLLTAPAPQVMELVGEHPFTSLLSSVVHDPCWVAMVTLPMAPVRPSPGGPVARVVGDGRHLALHATPGWSFEHLEASPEHVIATLVGALDLPEPEVAEAHRWRYARVRKGLDAEALYDPDLRLAIAGDAFAGGDARGALLSGAAAAGRLLA
ncbi:MAG: NAD(P)-binding protein [Myxococcales bacterium]|nr:NAD(P)-binding protein [Myxococcales bacterium]